VRQLLWKEIRELRGWLLGGAMWMGGFYFLLRAGVFDGSFAGLWTTFLMPLSAAIFAIGLGAGQVARERQSRTLDFLLVRPISARAIVWTKFLAGTIVLFLLLSGAVMLCYAQPRQWFDETAHIIWNQLSIWQMAAVLYPRYWSIYALALLFSALVERPSKAKALAGILGGTVLAVIFAFEELAPFSGFVFWVPFIETSGGLAEVARNWRLSGMTGLVYVAGALLIASISAVLLKRSPERYLGSWGVAIVAAGAIVGAIGVTYAASVRLPEVKPAGAWQFPESEIVSGLVASGRLVAYDSAAGSPISGFCGSLATETDSGNKAAIVECVA